MITSLICEHNRSLIPLIESFVTSCAQLAGANSEELRGFELAAEEISVHIIESFLPQSEVDSFTICCRSLENGLEFSFEDKGLPIDTVKALVYDTSLPDKFLDGLRFHIVRTVCDRFELKNHGKNGWMLTFFKSIKNFRMTDTLARAEDSGNDQKELEKIEIYQGCKADIPSLIELNYNVFRYTSEPEFYSKEGLEAMMDNPYHVFDLVKTTSGKVIASQEYCVDPKKNVDITWYGTMMTHPDYRGGGAMLKLFKQLKTAIETPPHPEAKLWVQYIVTSHTASQRFADMMEVSTCAMDLSRDRVMDFSGALKSIGQRETFLHSWRWLTAFKNSFTVRFHSLPEHDEIIRKIFSWQRILLETDVSLASELPPIGEPERLKVDISEYDRYALIYADSLPGAREEFGMQLRRKKDEAYAKGVQTVAMHVPTERPLPLYLSQSLREHGFFFSGIIPMSASKYRLHYTCLGAQSLDFDGLKLYAKTSIELHDYVKGEYGKV
jgi:anti-sigma regulatory factor (Ser/Thr protein kinase)